MKATQGYTPFGVEWKITDDDGVALPHDGRTFGRLKVRGPAVARRYFKREDEEILDEEGYFDTGDVATIDADGYMRITDRSKDVIKSGGVVPAFATTSSRGRSSHFGCGDADHGGLRRHPDARPPGSRWSMERIHSPPDLMTSFERSVIRM